MFQNQQNMSEVFLLFGSNLGDRFKIIAEAVDQTKHAIGDVIKASSVYESAPWGFDHENKFLNQVVILKTSHSPRKILHSIQNIEEKMGRVRNNSSTYSGRTIDIDILFYDDLVMNEKDLKIPHPLLHERRFTLKPLVEIASTYIHPAFHKTMQQLLEECPDEQEALKVPTDGY